MRSWSLLALAALLVAPAVAAQDACEEGTPCQWVVQIDEEGLSSPGGALEATVGDWFRFEFNNLDPDAAHTIAWSLDGSSWQVPALDTVESDPFALFQEGTYTLTDEATGDTLDATVTLDDVADDDGDEGVGSPAAGWLVLLAALAVAMAVRRGG